MNPAWTEGGLALLAEAFRTKATGFLVLGAPPDALTARIERGQISALGPAQPAASAAPLPKPSDSMRMRLERVLSEIGMRGVRPPSDQPPASLRDRLIDRLADEAQPARFGLDGPGGLVPTAVATEPLILEVVRQMRRDEAVRRALGDLDRRLTATAAFADERTLTLTEGYLLSRIDGAISARDVLRLVPLDARETERALLGLLLTGRVQCLPSAPAAGERAEPSAPESPVAAAAQEAAAPAPLPEGPASTTPLPASTPAAPAASSAQAPAPPAPPPVAPAPAPLAAPLPAPSSSTAEQPALDASAQGAGGSDDFDARPPEEAAFVFAEVVAEEEDDDAEASAEAARDAATAPTDRYETLPATDRYPAVDDDQLVPAVLEDDTPAVPPQPEGAPPATRVPLDPATAERRRDIVLFYQSLPFKQNHFDMLGVEPGCTDDEVKRAYVTLTKRYHPDANRDKLLEDLHDMLEAIIIRVGEAWEVVGEARSRASYEARAGIVRRPRPPQVQPRAGADAHAPAGAADKAPAGAGAGPPAAGAAKAPSEPPDYVPPEEILHRARTLLAQARYWDAIQVLESHLPGMEPRRQQHRGRLLLARAYSKNPNWLRRAEEMLQELLREDPTSADAHYELGLVYKTGGFVARAQAMFKRTLELRPGHKDAAAELGIHATAPQATGLLKRLFKRGKAS